MRRRRRDRTPPGETQQTPETLALSLISHTNAGKTTLARTLLRRDVGEVLDQAHVTELSEEFELLEAGGDRLVLWDTPGFGDSARLYDRLREQENPLGWLRSQVWDRIAERPLWCSQQAVVNVRDAADVVLYLVNAAEDPEMAGYVDPEMRILGWIDRPVIVLLNQTGPPADAEARRADEARWRAHLARHEVVRDVVSLDAFGRCWVQEGVLLERVREVLPEGRRPLLDRLLAQWKHRNLEVFRASLSKLADLLASAAADRELIGGGALARLDKRAAADALSRRLEQAIRDTTGELIELHDLEGDAAAELRGRLEDVSAPGEKPDPWRAGMLGGLAGGALGGLAADVASGGITFGGGAVAGALLGAAGLGGLAWGYQTLGGDAEPRVTWSPEFLDRATRDALLRYLAIAHFGRGSGAYHERDHPAFWREAVERALETRRGACRDAWELAQRHDPETGARLAGERLLPLLDSAAREALLAFYPEAPRFLE